MPIRERQRWFLKEWLKYRNLTYEKFAERLGTSKGVISDLANSRERYHRDHLWEFAQILDCEPWEIINRNPLEPPPVGIESIAETVQRIPIDERERALRAAQSMLETFATPPPTPISASRQKKKRA